MVEVSQNGVLDNVVAQDFPLGAGYSEHNSEVTWATVAFCTEGMPSLGEL